MSRSHSSVLAIKTTITVLAALLSFLFGGSAGAQPFSPTSKHMGVSGGSYSLSVNPLGYEGMDGKWRLSKVGFGSANQVWASFPVVYENGFVGPATVPITVASNPNIQPRTGSNGITLSIGGNSEHELTQDGKPPHLDISPASLAVPSGGGDYSLSVTCNPDLHWSFYHTSVGYTYLPDDIHGRTGSSTINFRLFSNPDSVTRTGTYELKFAGLNEQGQHTIITRTFTFTQAAHAPDASFFPQSFDAPNAGTEYQVQLYANTDWSVGSLPSWLQITPASDSGNTWRKRILTVTVASNPGGVERNFPLTINGATHTLRQGNYSVEPDLKVTGWSHGATADLGSGRIGGTGVPQSFTLRNMGTAPLSPLAISITGPHAADFSLNGTLPTSLPPFFDNSAAINVSFTPSAEGARNATLRITSNDPDEPVYEIALRGEGIPLVLPGESDNTLSGGGIYGGAVNAIALQVDGKILIGGAFTSYNGTARSGIARLNSDGSLDTSFAPGAGVKYGSGVGSVYTLIPQSDGKILIGGYFNTYNGTARNNIARLNADGSLDSSFDPGSGANTFVYALALQSDGKVLIGGSLTSYNGTSRNGITRLNSDGSLDTSFDPGSGIGSSSAVRTIALQPDGKILIGGQFNTYNGTTSPRIARLNSDGSRDTSFDPGSGPNSSMVSIALQPDGKILVGGNFGLFNGTVRQYIARLNSDGSLDASFVPSGVSGSLNCIALQVDGKILIGASSVARFNSDGSPDLAFKITASASLNAFAVQADGRVLIGGSATSVGGLANGYLVRLANTAASQSLAVTSAARLAWMRSGSVPEVGRMSLEYSADTVSWSSLGEAVRINGGWELTGLSLQESGYIRAIGRVADDSGSLMGAFAVYDGFAAPEITVSGNGQNIGNGDIEPEAADHTDFGENAAGTGMRTRTFTIRNAVGAAAPLHLTGQPRVQFGGPQAEYFSVVEQPASSLAPGDSTTFTIVFAPNAPGLREAFVSIPSDDEDRHPFVFAIAGEGTGTAGQPEIVLSGNGSEIADGEDAPSPLNHTDFGTVLSSVGALTRSFTVANSGMAPLLLNGSPRVQISGAHAADFTVTTSPAESVGAGVSTAFTLSFTPSASGERRAWVSIASNDSDEPFYTFSIRGEGLTIAGQPDLVSFNPPGLISGYIEAVVVQPDGKVLIGGNFTLQNGATHRNIARLNSDGSLDTSFEPGFGTNNIVYSLALQPDGKILIGGTFTSQNGTVRNRIARFNSDGSVDTSFDPGSGANNAVYSLALQADGKILICGSFSTYNSTARNGIARLNSDGSLDTSFGLGVGADRIDRIALQPDGKILIGGSFISYNGTARNRIARLNSDGSLDASFNPGSGANQSVNSLALQVDGKILIGGQFTSYNGTARKNIARLNSNGSLDTSFDPGSLGFTGVGSIALQADGKILIGSTFIGEWQRRVTRLNSDGSLDIGFETSFEPGIGTNSLVSITLQPDGKILIGGNFTTYKGTAHLGVARLNSDGSVEAGFNPGAGSSAGPDANVASIAVQPDGKVLIGGSFTSYNGVACNRITRLHSNGFLDEAFNVGSGVNKQVDAITVQADGKILIGGWFTSYNGVARNGIARLNSDGSLDTSFGLGSGVSGPSSRISVIALQVDGKILIGGNFTSYNGTPRGSIARLNSDGSLDPTFDPGVGFVGSTNYVSTVALQANGKIVLGGAFSTYNGTARRCIARVNGDGSLDTSFDPGAGVSNILYSLVLRPDGKILIGGQFASYNGTARNNVAQLNADGSVDTSFDPGSGANSYVVALALQSDGKVLIGGGLTSYNGVARKGIARLNSNGSVDAGFDPGVGALGISTLSLRSDGGILAGGFAARYLVLVKNTPAAQTLSAISTGHVVWLRGGSAPELYHATFDYSADGDSWTPLGSATRTNGGWEKTGLTLPASGHLRTRGWAATSGINGCGSSFIEQVVSYSGFQISEIALSGNGMGISNGDITPSAADHTDFGTLPVNGGGLVRTFTLSNSGTAPLHLFGSPSVQISGVGAADFSVTALPAASLGAGSQSSFTIRFDPSASGLRSASVSITNDDADENPFTFVIQGTGTGDVDRPEIALYGSGVRISSGDATPSMVDHTDFGATHVSGGLLSRTYVISNQGDAPLRLTGGTLVEISGAHAADFMVTTPPVALIEAGGHTSLTITFDPSVTGERNAAVSIASDDADENFFTFAVKGTGTGVLLLPEITISGNGVSIANGDSTTSLADNTDFGSAVVTGGTMVRNFTVSNTGNAPLSLTGSPRVQISGAHAADFTVTVQPASSVATAGSTTFTITFGPAITGVRSASVSIVSDDTDENPFNFGIQGTGITAQLGFTNFIAANSPLSGSDAAIDATPFHDGVENLLKYAFNMNLSGPDVSSLVPGSGTAGLPSVTVPEDAPEGTLCVQFVRRKGSGLIYTPQKSMSLESGSWMPLSSVPVVTSIDDQWERVTYEEPPADTPTAQCFARVRVELP